MSPRLNPALQLLVLACAGALAACTSLQPRAPMPIAEVVSLSKSANAPDRAISRLRESRTTYALRGSDFAELAQLGVSDPVLDELQQAFVNDVDRLTRYWVLGESLGACTACYPQPLDLASLQAGGDGMADASYLGAYYSFARPPGVPEWVPASPGRPLGKMIWIDDVENWIGEGVSAEEIATRIRDSRLKHVVGSGGGATRVGTHFTVALKGSELAALSGRDAADPVLDALQEKFLAEFIEFSRLRHQHEGKGGPRP
jgi:hypothetical protein